MANVNDENTLVVFDGFERQELEVLFQDEVVLDIEVPLFYIKSGEEEIQYYVDTVAKPDLNGYTGLKKEDLDSYADEKKQEISNFSLERQGVIEENLDNYADSTLKPQLNEFVTAAETAAGNAETSALAASGSAAAALVSKTAASASAASAEAAVNGFDAHVSEKQTAFDSNVVEKTTSFNDNFDAKTDLFNNNTVNKTAVFNENAVEKTTSFNSNATEKQASVDASTEMARKYAQGNLDELPSGSAEYWAEQARNAAGVAGNSLYDRMGNCLLAAPADWLTVDGKTIVTKAGIKSLAANGINEDGTKNNLEVIEAQQRSKDLSQDLSVFNYGVVVVRQYKSGAVSCSVCRNYFVQDDEPDGLISDANYMWYSPKTNLLQQKILNGTWQKWEGAILAILDVLNSNIVKITQFPVMNVVTEHDFTQKMSLVKLIGFENARTIECDGETTISLQPEDEIIVLKVNADAQINFDFNIKYPRPVYTIQCRLWFSDGVKTVTLNASTGITWIYGAIPDLSDGKPHWFVLRASSEWNSNYILGSDAGTEG